MDQEQDWLNRADSDDSDGAAERYQYFMRPEPKDDLGPIETINDPYLGPNTKIRRMTVGMVRNAKDENKKEVLAYLHPFPHTRIDTAKPLQGWYKSLHEPAGVRPRPCFSEAILTEPYGGFCAVGCAFCLPAGERVDTPDGTKSIESLREGDLVWGRFPNGVRPTKVTGTLVRTATEGIIEVTVSDGRVLRMTGNHPVYSKSRGWVPAEDLRVGEPLEDLPLFSMRNPVVKQGILSSLLVGEESTEAVAGEAVQGLLRPSRQSVADGMPDVRNQNPSLQRRKNQGVVLSAKGRSEVRRDAEEDVRAREEQQRQHVSAGQRSEVRSVPAGQSRGRKTREGGIPTLEAGSVRLSEGKNLQHEVSLGDSHSEALRQQSDRLGVRDGISVASRRVGVHPRLLATGSESLRGSEGVYDSFGTREDRGREAPRTRHRGLEREGTEVSGNPYVRGIVRVLGEVTVYDIQTESENFYTNGVLVHNCYINAGFRGYRGTGLITVPMNYGQQIAKQIKGMRRSAAGYFSSFTDPFTPLEQYYHNTQEAAEEFHKAGLPVFFLSRLRYPDWAVDLLQQNPYSYAQKSINTPDPDDWRKLSPGAMSLEDHFQDIARLRKAGIYVSIQCNPIVAGVTSHADVIALFKKLAEAGANHVIVKFVEAGYSWAPTMVEKMIRRFGDRGKEFEKLFTENIGGQRTIQESYRVKAHEMYSKFARRYGLTYATCYEYAYERNVDGSIKDKTGVSLGRKYTTAEQCHGQRVPVFTRDSAEEQFREVEACPPSGCLYCASENGGEARCGDELAGEANAVRAADLRKPIGGVAGRHREEGTISLGRIVR